MKIKIFRMKKASGFFFMACMSSYAQFAYVRYGMRQKSLFFARRKLEEEKKEVKRMKAAAPTYYYYIAGPFL